MVKRLGIVIAGVVVTETLLATTTSIQAATVKKSNGWIGDRGS